MRKVDPDQAKRYRQRTGPMSSDSQMAGDFLSLLAAQKLAPWRGEVSASAPVQTQATTVFAFHFAEGVLMAGDRRATAGNLIVTDRVDKVIEIDATSLLAIAGVPATAFEMARILQTSFEYYRRSQLQSLSLPAKVRALARLLRENLPMTMQGVGIVAPLFARHSIGPVTPAKPQGDLFLRPARRAIPVRELCCFRLRLRHHPQRSQLPGATRLSPRPSQTEARWKR